MLRVVAPFFYGSVYEFGAVVAMKLPKRERNDLEDVFEGLKSPCMSLIEQGVEENPA